MFSDHIQWSRHNFRFFSKWDSTFKHWVITSNDCLKHNLTYYFIAYGSSLFIKTEESKSAIYSFHHSVQVWCSWSTIFPDFTFRSFRVISWTSLPFSHLISLSLSRQLSLLGAIFLTVVLFDSSFALRNGMMSILASPNGSSLLVTSLSHTDCIHKTIDHVINSNFLQVCNELMIFFNICF